uniref:Transient receptor potential cation channel subfamily M member 5-like n=1 Tax=Callorhinchus milii TaxID=7868 RepID=A0A4W3HE27_CALMI
MKDVFFFLFFLGIWLVAYGVTTQGLLHPGEARLSWIFRRVFYRPYLQIFGQIPLNEIDVMDLSKLASSKLMTWEMVQKENYLVNREKLNRERDGERLKRTGQKVDNILKYMTDIREHERRLRILEEEVDYCTNALTWLVESLDQSDLIKSSRSPPRYTGSSIRKEIKP